MILEKLSEQTDEIQNIFNDLYEIFIELFGDDIGLEFIANYFDIFPVEIQKKVLKLIYNFISDFIGFNADDKMAIDDIVNDLNNIQLNIEEDEDVIDQSDDIAPVPKRLQMQYRKSRQILRNPEKLSKFIFSFDSDEFIPREKELDNEKLEKIKSKLNFIKQKIGA